MCEGQGNFIDECIAQARTLHGECFAVSNRIELMVI